jgi:hypothetical protein
LLILFHHLLPLLIATLSYFRSSFVFILCSISLTILTNKQTIKLTN